MIRKQIIVFIFVGLTAVAIDYVSYLSFLHLLNQILFAKALGFFAGAIFSFYANKHLTFSYKLNNKSHRVKFLVVYLMSLLANTLINDSILNLDLENQFSIQMAFFVATGASAILNFWGMKYYVFTAKSRWCK